MSAPAAERWVVKCDDYTTRPYRSREAAEQAMEQIEADHHCELTHAVEQA